MANETVLPYQFEKELLKQVFNKIEAEKGGKTKNKWTEILEGILEDDYTCFEPKKRTLLRWYDRFILDRDVECGDPNITVKNHLADFLGYNDYHEFVSSIKKDNSDPFISTDQTTDYLSKIKLKKTKKAIPVTRIALASVFAIAIITIFYFFNSFSVNANDKHSMVWVGDHFEEYTTETNMVHLGLNKLTLVPYNEEAILYHKKIELDCDDAIKKVWFYKVNNHELELFNFPGLHPVNGETLKKLTPYMKKNYVCGKVD